MYIVGLKLQVRAPQRTFASEATFGSCSAPAAGAAGSSRWKSRSRLGLGGQGAATALLSSSQLAAHSRQGARVVRLNRTNTPNSPGEAPCYPRFALGELVYRLGGVLSSLGSQSWDWIMCPFDFLTINGGKSPRGEEGSMKANEVGDGGTIAEKGQVEGASSDIARSDTEVQVQDMSDTFTATSLPVSLRSR